MLATIGLAETLGCRMNVATFGVDIPPVASSQGGFPINIEGMERAAEDRGTSECERPRASFEAGAKGHRAIPFTRHQPLLGAAPEAATYDPRYFDLALVPWSAVSAQDMAQSLVFGSGLPAVLVPSSVRFETVDHIATALDESRVAARALGNALRLPTDGGRISVLTFQGEKALSGPGIAETHAASLALRGNAARAANLKRAGKTIATAIQNAAICVGARLLAMGRFVRSRLRDFALGGATKGILGDLRLRVLMAH